MRIALIIYTLCFLCFPSIGQNRLHISTNIDSAKIGEPIELTVKLDYSADIGSVNWPDFKEDSTIGGDFEIWGVGEINKKSQVDANDASLSIVQTLKVVSFNSGYIPFMPLAVILDEDTIESNALLLNIAEIKVDTTQGFNDIKSVMSDPLTFWEQFTYWIGNNWWWVAIASLGIVILLFILFRRKPKPVQLDTPVSLYDKYTELLNSLLERELWSNQKVKEHYVELTDLIRSYYFERYGVSTFEKTTNEIVTITDSINIDKETSYAVIQVFKISEYVKFAKKIPSDFEILQHNQTIKQLLEVTQPVETKEDSDT